MSYYDAQETRSPASREAALMAALAGQVAHAKAATPYYAQTLAAVDAAACSTREALAALPLTRKRDMIALQKATPPFGGLNALDKARALRVFSSPGPIYELQGESTDIKKRFWPSIAKSNRHCSTRLL